MRASPHFCVVIISIAIDDTYVCGYKLYLLNTVLAAQYLSGSLTSSVPVNWNCTSCVSTWLDILGLDILGLDILGLDILGLGILGMTRRGICKHG